MIAVEGRPFNLIELWPKEIDCILCGAADKVGHWLPMYEGKVVSDDYTGEWAGMPVCPGCYLLHERIEKCR